MARRMIFGYSVGHLRETLPLVRLSCCLVVIFQLAIPGEAVLAEVSGDRLRDQTAEDIDAAVISTVLANWHRRAAELKSLQFELEIIETADEASIKALDQDRERMRSLQPRQNQPTVPPPDATPAKDGDNLPVVQNKRVARAKFAWDGAKIMFEIDGPIFHLGQNKYVPRQEKTAYNGNETRSIKSRPDSDTVQGTIWEGKHETFFDLVRYVPLHWWIGGIWHDRQAVASPFTLADYPRNSHDPIALIKKSGGLEIWVDPSRDYIVTRIVNDRPVAKRHVEIDVSYQPHDDVGWVIDRWHVVLTSGGGKEVTTCQLSDVKVNQTIDPTVFEIDFPRGATVIDARQEGEPIYRVDDDGELVPLER